MDIKKPHEISLMDVEMWAEHSPRENFKIILHQARKLLGNPKKLTDVHFAQFKKHYKIMWNYDNSITIYRINSTET